MNARLTAAEKQANSCREVPGWAWGPGTAGLVSLAASHEPIGHPEGTHSEGNPTSELTAPERPSGPARPSGRLSRTGASSLSSMLTYPRHRPERIVQSARANPTESLLR